MSEVASVPTSAIIAVALLIFLLGLAGVLIRRDLIYVLMSLEIMFNGAALAFIGAAAKWRQPDGQVMVILILVAAAAEVGVGLSLLLRLYHRFKTVDGDQVSLMRG